MIQFASVYQEHSGAVHRFALHLSGDPSWAEDITSETFIRVWTARDRIRLATVRGYLLTIARNLYLQDLRRSRRRRALDPELHDPAPGPAAVAAARAELRRVLDALQELPEVDRAALLMRAEDALPYQEIANALDLSLAAVKVKIHRARLRLATARHRAAPKE